MVREQIIVGDELNIHLIKGKHHNRRKFLDFFNKERKRKNGKNND